ASQYSQVNAMTCAAPSASFLSARMEAARASTSTFGRRRGGGVAVPSGFAAAGGGGWAEGAGMVSGFLQPVQTACWPASSSGAVRTFGQFGHGNLIGMARGTRGPEDGIEPHPRLYHGRRAPAYSGNKAQGHGVRGGHGTTRNKEKGQPVPLL